MATLSDSAANPTIRTFRAADTRAAIRAVKAAFGPEAVIISTREIGGGMFRRPDVEVTAALSFEPAAAPPPPAPRSAAPSPASYRGGPIAPAAESVRRYEASAPRPQSVPFGRPDHDLDLIPSALEVYRHLVHRGVEETLAEEVVRQAISDGHASRTDALFSGVREILAERLVPCRAPWLRDRQRVIALVGPTGVGKTTTIAKIAAKALMESRIKVSLITVDTYRIGASEQLGRYGEIMGVPTYVARDRGELVRAVERSTGADLILIDTAGRSVSEAVAQQAELIRSVAGVQLHLVLSAATGARECAAAAERYRPMRPERVIVSKVDEAVGPGSLLSAVVRINRPITCVSDGQRVPEDLHALTASELVELVLGRSEPARADGTGGRR